MENRRVSVKPILSILLILAVLCAVFTLTACSKELDAVSIEVVKETIPDVATVGSFELSQLKLKVDCADGRTQEIAVTLSMLDTASKNSLKEPGEKNINVFYNGKATNFTIFLVEEGTKTVSVTFLAQDSTIIAKKHAVAGNAIEAPQAPSVAGQVFDSWRNKDNSQEVDLSSVSANLVVFAHYTENAAKYTVKFYDYTNKLIDTYENVAHNSTITPPNWTQPSAIKSFSWNWSFAQKVTQSIEIRMTVEYRDCDISFQYALSENGPRYNLATKKSAKIGGFLSESEKEGAMLSAKDLQDAKNEMTQKGLDFVSWFNLDELKTNTSTTYTLVAIVKSSAYSIRFIDQEHGDATINSGERFTMPTTYLPKQGHTFSNTWRDTLTGTIYTAGNSYPITSNLVLEGVYTPLKDITFIFTFDGLRDDGGQILSYEVKRELNQIPSVEYLSNLLVELKNDKENDDIANYDIKSTNVQGNIYNVDCHDTTQRLEYVLNEAQDGYIVSKYSRIEDKNILLKIAIPENYNNKPVVGIADGVFRNYTALKEVILPSSVISIGANAFAGCRTLEKVNLNDVTILKERAFEDCINLAEVGSLDNIATIENYALSATNLINISLPSVTSLGNLVFLSTKELQTLLIGGANGAITFDFANIMGSSVKELTLGANVVALANTISENFDEIGKLSANEVYALSKLTKINFAKELETINVAAFNLFSQIKVITVEAGSNYAVDNNVLFNQNSLVYYPPTVYGDYVVPSEVNGIAITNIAKDAFIKANFYKLVLHENIVSIGTNNCATLNIVEMSLATLEAIFGQSVTLSESVTVQNILSSIDAKFKSGVTYFINDYAELEQDGKDKLDLLTADVSRRFIVDYNTMLNFYDQQSMLLYTVNNNEATIIGIHKAATSVIIPNTLGGVPVKQIAKGAFKGRENLTSITLPDSLETIMDNAFEGTSLKEINLNAVTTVGKYVFKNCIQLQKVVIPKAINKLTSEGRVSVGMFYGCSSLTSVTMDNVDSFAHENGKSEAFYGCSSLEDVSFLSRIAGIIYEDTFNGCKAIKSINLTVDSYGNSRDRITEIRARAFYDCTNLTYLEIGAVNIIASQAFASTQLKTVWIKGTAGIFTRGLEISADVFPQDVIIYMDITDTTLADTVLKNYPNRKTAKPRISFEMLDGFKATENEFRMDIRFSSYIATSPDAPIIPEYEFVSWFVEDAEGNNVKAVFPMTFTKNTVLKAKYYSVYKGSVVFENLELIKDNNYKLISYTSTDDICYIPYIFKHDGKDLYIREINLSLFVGTSIKKLVIPESVTTLTGSLVGSAITEITIAKSVTDITDNQAFTDMTNLNIIWAAESNLTNASLNAFIGTKWYTKANDEAKSGANNRFVVAGRLALQYILANSDADKVIIVPSQIIKLNDNLFPTANSLYTAVTTITLNDGLKAIGNSSLVGLTNLTTINYQTLASNSQIEKVSIGAFPSNWVNNRSQIIIGKIFLKYRSLSYIDTFNVPAYITTIAPNAFEEAKIKEVKFAGNNVITIGKNAFKKSIIQNIVLPSSVKTMGEGVFQECEQLKKADFSQASITELPINTFYGCINLTELILNAKVAKFARYSLQLCDKLISITADGLVDTTDLLLSGLTSTAWYKISGGEKGLHLVLGKVYVKYIKGTNPVLNEDKLVEVVIPSGVTVILAEAFADITNLGKVTISATVETIEEKAFNNLTTLKEVVFADGSELKTIGKSAFSKTSNLTSILLPEGLITIKDNAFDASNLKTISIPDSVKTIGMQAFANNKLESIVLGKGLVSIGELAFANNNELYKVNWNVEVEEMFNEVDKKTADTIKQLYNLYVKSKNEEEVYVLDANYVHNIFSRASNETFIRIYISNDAHAIIFGNSPYLLVWTEEPTGENKKFFEIVKDGELPEVSFDKDGYIMESFRAEVINKGDLKTPSRTGHTFIRWEVLGKEITYPYPVRGNIVLTAVWVSNAKSMTELQPDGYIDNLRYELNDDGFYTITGVKEGVSVIYIPSTLDLIPIKGFELVGSYEDVTKIIFTKASNLSRLETNIFYPFTNLEAVELRDSNVFNVNYKVENGAMYSLDGKELIAYFIQKDQDNEIQTSFVMPKGVTKIMPNAFANSGLASISIPRSVTTIGKHAFNDELASIIFREPEKGEEPIYLTDANRESFENTQWYLNSSWANYYFNDSPVGKFYAAANILLTYEETSAIHELKLPSIVNGYDITVLASYLRSDYVDDSEQEATLYDKIVLPDKLKKISTAAFAHMDAVDFDGTNCKGTLVDIADDVFTDTDYYKKTATRDNGLIVLGKVLLRYQNTSSILDLTALDATKSITTISKQAFMGSQFTKITLPATLTYIADEAFLSNTKLEELVIPVGVNKIGASAFKYCTELNKITFADNSAMVEIGKEAFSGCLKLKSIKVPYTVTVVGDSAFANCLSLETVTFDKIVETENEAGIIEKNITNKSELISLGAGAFQDCSSLTSIAIPNKLAEIKESTFKNCTSLVNVLFETDKSRVKYIRKEAFFGCIALGSIIDVKNPNLITLVLPNTLIVVEDRVFAGCEGLYGVRFNYSIDTIGTDVFLGCIKLAKIEVYADTPPQMPSGALKRETGTKQPYYNLRVYVKNVTKVLNDYNIAWAEYEKNIFPMGEYAKLSYRYSADGTTIDPIPESINKLSDVYVNHSFLFTSIKVEVTTWKFFSITDPRAESPTDPIIGGSRIDKQLGAEAYAYQRQYNTLTSSYDIILIVDYDMVLQNV